MNTLEKLEQGVTTYSKEETWLLAKTFSEFLPKNTTLCMSGNLGTGKTTFIQGLAKAWGIEDAITSPTFNLYSIYEGSRQLVHVDAYRLESPERANDLLIEEFLKPPYCLAIEWPEKVEGWYEPDAWVLNFEIQEPGEHHITLKLPDIEQSNT